MDKMTWEKLMSIQLRLCYQTVFCPYPYSPYDALMERAKR